MRALVVDDDPVLADVVAFTLRREGFVIEIVHNGASALDRWRDGMFDILVLDVNLPDIDGFRLCRKIRAEDDDLPIVLLTVRDEEDDIVSGLKLGADDYVTKPFSPRQLVARVQAVLRRAGKTPTRAMRRMGDLVLWLNRRELCFAESEPVGLTRLENRLLDYLMLNQGRIMSAEALIDYVWPDGGDRDMLRQLVHRLRTKMTFALDTAPDQSNDYVIQNIPGLGYGLRIC